MTTTLEAPMSTAAPTASISAAQGKAARTVAPRRSHAEFVPAPDRSDPVDLLERQARTRVPELVPIRYGRMLVSPFTFYRGAAAIMAADLASTPSSGLQVQCCGDAHLSNFGVFASPDRRLVFDLNDFDETLPGPWEWDVKRLAASMLIAAQTNGFRRKEQRRIVLDMVASYRTTMATFASMGNLDVWYSRFEIEDVLARYEAQFKTRIVKRAKKALAKARTRDSMSAASKLCEVVDGEMRIVDQSPLIIPIDRLGRGARDQTFGRLRGMVDTYRETLPADRRSLLDQFDLVDFAHKVVGVGSVGNEAWIALLLGSVGQDVLFLQVKEAQPSVLEDHAGASEFENHGERVVIGQRRMQASSDIFLGWLRVDEEQRGGQRDYYCRQLRDWKASAEIEQMYPDGMAIYGQMCGWTLARAHARTGDRVAIAAYLGGSDSFDQAILAFSEAYAEQNELDYAALQSAEKSGRVVAKAGL